MAGNVKITIDGDDELIVEFAGAAALTGPKITEAISDIGFFIQSEARRNVKQRTGNLFKNIAFDGVRQIAPGVWVAVIGVMRTAPYGKWVEQGTGLFHPTAPHWIYPRNGNFMAWTEKGFTATKYQGKHVTAITVKPGKLVTVEAKTFRKGAVYRILAKKTRGQRGQKFLERAYIEAKLTYIPARLKKLGAELDT